MTLQHVYKYRFFVGDSRPELEGHLTEYANTFQSKAVHRVTRWWLIHNANRGLMWSFR